LERTLKVKTFSIQIAKSDRPLSDLLSKHLKEDFNLDLSRREILDLFKYRRVSLRGRPISSPSWSVDKSSTIKVQIPISILRKSSKALKLRQISLELNESAVIYEDEYILVANKPVGIPSQQTLDPKRDHFLAAVKRLLTTRKGREPYLVLHHRLDLDTSGLLLFSKKKGLNKVLGEMFSNRQIKKTYLCVCYGQNPPPLKWRIENFLGKSSEHKMKRTAVKAGGDKAITNFELIQDKTPFFFIKASPVTGRMHQIRVHLSEYGLPIIGDPFYSNNEVQTKAQRLLLHASRLEFEHPVSQKLIKIDSPTPNEFLEFF
jgi:RluA family pseudouridine synthase